MLLLPPLEAQTACGQLVDRAGDKLGYKLGDQLGAASGLLCQGNALHWSTIGASFVSRCGRGGLVWQTQSRRDSAPSTLTRV